MGGLSFKWKLQNPYLVASVACVAGMLMGFDISSVSGFIGNKSYREFFHKPSATRQAGITASMPAGSFGGALTAGFISDAIGRQATIQIACWIWMVGAAIQCSSRNVVQLIIGRVIAGIGVGFATSQAPVYIAEMAPKNIRGRLVGFFQFATVCGVMIMFYIAYGCGHIESNAAWRTAWGILMVPGFFLFIGTLFLNESPRWLAKQDRWEEAIAIIAQIQAKGNRDDPQFLVEVEEIKEAVRIEHLKKTTFIGMFRGRVNFRRTMTAWWCQTWHQLTGSNAMFYYVVNVFEMAGYNGNADLIASSIQYVINTVMTIPSLIWIDKWGRRPLFISGSIIMLTFHFAMAGMFKTYALPTGPGGFEGNDAIRMRIPDDKKWAGKVIIALSYLFVGTFAVTWGPAGWIYVSEIFPLEQRARGNGIGTAANWAFNFAISMFSPVAFRNITWRTYLIYGSCTFAGLIHAFLMFPETKGKTLEEIDLMWESGVPAWRSASWVPPVVDVDAIRALGGGDAPSLKEKVDHLENASVYTGSTHAEPGEHGEAPPYNSVA